MKISYNRLWKLLIDKGMTRQDLREKTGISSASIAKMGKGENINTGLLVKICEALNCNTDDIMEIVPDEDSSKSEASEERK
ncbi:helix-turn-helix domain-containing protein [Bacillota bacterium LCP21S3_G6]